MKSRVLVTGSTSGLGLHLAKKFEDEGHFVFRHMGRKHCDLSNLNEIQALIEMAKNEKIDVLVNNAAITCPGKCLSEYNSQEIVDMIQVNLTAPIFLVHGLIEQLTDIININSMVGLEIKPKRTMYSATKWGLRGFSQSLSAENNRLSILDVFPTNIQTSPEKMNALNLEYVLDQIYISFLKKDKRLVLDGRK